MNISLDPTHTHEGSCVFFSFIGVVLLIHYFANQTMKNNDFVCFALLICMLHAVSNAQQTCY